MKFLLTEWLCTFCEAAQECGEGVCDMGETENLRLCRISGAREGGGEGEGETDRERERERETFILICFVCTSVRINATE